MCASTSADGLLRARLGASPLCLPQELSEKRFLCTFRLSRSLFLVEHRAWRNLSSSWPSFSLLLGRLRLWDSSFLLCKISLKT
ncbi:hypothetical protein NPIL_180271 [Nephila pilipes]|uniref:Uncharacterized protein n=1 Tax=Nephila pilipes TaxID=299642 RepID=A0A8X6UIR6_NEPPI|nr:hypothetical protein NPIL_180271 [Nephila pilipes]